jgi:Holliday junction resolvase RusA-like endonuclease
MTAEAITFTVYGLPQTAGSKRAFIIKTKGGGQRAIVTDANAKGKDWKGDVKQAAAAFVNGGHTLLQGPLRVSMVFFLPRPTSHYGSGKNASAVKSSSPRHPIGKPDVLKLARCVEDALTGVLWVDDAQITSEQLAKRYCEFGQQPGCQVIVTADAE